MMNNRSKVCVDQPVRARNGVFASYKVKIGPKRKKIDKKGLKRDEKGLKVAFSDQIHLSFSAYLFCGIVWEKNPQNDSSKAPL